MPIDDNEKVRVVVQTKDGPQDMEVTVEELRKGYMLNAEYTRKTQSLSAEKAAIEEQLAEVDKLRNEVTEWNKWYADEFLKTAGVKPKKEEIKMAEEKKPEVKVESVQTSNAQVDALAAQLKAMNDAIAKLQGSLNALSPRIEQNESTLNRYFQYTTDLNAARREFVKANPGVEFNEDAVVALAEASGRGDLVKADWDAFAIQAHNEDIINRKVEEGIKAKAIPPGPGSDGGSTATLFRLPSTEGRPKSFAEAAEKSMSLLKDI